LAFSQKLSLSCGKGASRGKQHYGIGMGHLWDRFAWLLTLTPFSPTLCHSEDGGERNWNDGKPDGSS
jgi:hypothetical protein